MPSRLMLAAALALASAVLAAFSAQAAGPSPATPQPPPATTQAPVTSQPAPPTASLPPGNTVVARVDGTELRLADVEAAQRTLPPEMQKVPLAQIYPMLLNRLIDGLLVVEAGRKEHLDQNPEVQQRLKLLQDRLIQQAYIEQLIKGSETEDKLKTGYDKFIKDKPGREEVHARHILVKTEAEANAIIDQLNKGADFASLAKKNSTDPGAASGGDLGYFGRGDMVPAFSAAAFALQPGQYTKTPVKTEFGWHVILVEDRRTKPPPTYDEARKEVSSLLARDIIQAKLKDLHDQAKIQAFGLDGKPLETTQ